MWLFSFAEGWKTKGARKTRIAIQLISGVCKSRNNLNLNLMTNFTDVDESFNDEVIIRFSLFCAMPFSFRSLRSLLLPLFTISLCEFPLFSFLLPLFFLSLGFFLFVSLFLLLFYFSFLFTSVNNLFFLCI